MTITTPDWVQDAIFYQIFPDRFARSAHNPNNGLPFESWDSPPTTFGFKGGDLYGVAERLDYLKDLGITALYLNPIFASASNHRYHTFDYFNVDPLLGGNEAFRFLLDNAHKKDIRIVLDGVFNHASRGFWQFHHVLENGLSSPYKDWFYFDNERLTGKKHWGAYPSPQEQKQLAHEDSLTSIGYRGWWNLPALPKLNVNTPAVREFLFDVAEHWVKFGIDGWRLDVAAEIDDDAFWQEFRNRVRAVNPEAYIVGEIWHESQRWLQGDQFDAVMNYLVTAAVISFTAGERLNLEVVKQAGGLNGRVNPHIGAIGFANEIDRLLSLYKPDINYAQLNLLDSHDMPRFLTIANGDNASLQLAWLFMFTYLGAPCIYYGDEIGIDGGHDPDCRKSFPWDEKKWDKNLLNYAKEVIALRRKNPALRRGSYKRLWSENGVYAFSRSFEGKTFVVAINSSESPQQIHVTNDAKKMPKPIFGEVSEMSIINGRLNFKIPPRSGAVLK
ncbi:MAG TPA: alpha-amylase [Anaerolineae bacterium]|nr:alpha-amylase [Anaerolineae bacterium]